MSGSVSSWADAEIGWTADGGGGVTLSERRLWNTENSRAETGAGPLFGGCTRANSSVSYLSLLWCF